MSDKLHVTYVILTFNINTGYNAIEVSSKVIQTHSFFQNVFGYTLFLLFTFHYKYEIVQYK